MTTIAAVRMGEMAVSRDGALSCVGLGSCIGLALLDPARHVAGLAHIMLPSTPTGSTLNGRYADVAVPELARMLVHEGARSRGLVAVIAGGASMFALSGGAGAEIGARNTAAVREQLEILGVCLLAQDVGGNQGRTVRVHPVDNSVTCKTATGAEHTLWKDRS